MKGLTLLAFFLLAGVYCDQGEDIAEWLNNVGEVQRAAPCNNPVPGLLRMQRGIDIVALSMLPYTTEDNDGYERPVIDITCSQGNKWTNPHNNIGYDLPDQVSDIAMVPGGGALDNTIVVITSPAGARQSLANQVEIVPEGGKIFGFSDAALYRRMHHSLLNESKFIQTVSSHVNAVRVDWAPPFALNLTATATQFINQFLPNNYDDNPEAYLQFINYFGTHYFEQARLGGLLKIQLNTDRGLYGNFTQEQIRQESELAFMRFLKLIGAHDREVRAPDTRFTSVTAEHRRYFGGQGSLLDPQFYQKWVPTVSNNPWLFSGHILPISLLIADNNKRAGMERAVQVHNDKGVLRELERNVISFKRTIDTSIVLSPGWDRCDALPPNQCDLRRIGSGRYCGCNVTGCDWKIFVPLRKQQLAENADSLLVEIRTEMASNSTNHNTVNSLTQRSRDLTQTLAWDSPLRTVQARRLSGRPNTCHFECESWQRCRCCRQVEVWGRLTAPQQFFNVNET